MEDEFLKTWFCSPSGNYRPSHQENTKKSFEEYPDVEWRFITGMRDRLIHGYLGIDYDIVREVGENHIPHLNEVISQMLLRDDFTEALENANALRFYSRIAYFYDDPHLHL